MTHIITYSLKPDAVNSDKYYRTISTFADSWLARTIPAVLDLVTGFRAYRLSRGETDRSDAEYTFELLALGVLIRERGEEAGFYPKCRQARALRSSLSLVQLASNWHVPDGSSDKILGTA